jgi:hypothetical protein
MNELIEKLSLQETRPISVQIADNAVWEKMLKAPLSKGMGTIDYKKDFSDPSDRIAVELFYELNDGRHAFLGVRYGNLLNKVSSPLSFLSKFIELLPAVAELSLPEAAVIVGQELAGDPQLLLGKDVSFLELGVCDWWLSEGSKRIWEQGEAQLTEEELTSKLSGEQQLLVNKKNFVALEIAINQPEHWLGIEVSEHVDGEYRLDIDSIVGLAKVATK